MYGYVDRGAWPSGYNVRFLTMRPEFESHQGQFFRNVTYGCYQPGEATPVCGTFGKNLKTIL